MPKPCEKNTATNLSTKAIVKIKANGRFSQYSLIIFISKNYIFTKNDEAQGRGAIVNQLMKLNLPISYITNGQNVPEDIEIASREKIAKLVLNNN